MRQKYPQAAERLAHLTYRATHPLLQEWPLVTATGESLVDQNFYLNASVLGSPRFSLIRCRFSVFAHRARSHDMPDPHPALLDQISDHRFSAVLAQFHERKAQTCC